MQNAEGSYIKLPPLIKPDWLKHYRIIPSVFPPINFYEKLVSPEHMEALWHLESLTNERLLAETGNIQLVDVADRVSGPGASVVMAPFTHINTATRFSKGDYGIYYAAKSCETALYETIYHRERFMRFTQEAPGEINMRVYVGKLKVSLHDIRATEYDYLHHPDDYQPSQQYGQQIRQTLSWGLLYRSVRNAGSECIALFRPTATSIPTQGEHFAYVWNGEKIAYVYKKGEPLLGTIPSSTLVD